MYSQHVSIHIMKNRTHTDHASSSMNCTIYINLLTYFLEVIVKLCILITCVESLFLSLQIEIRKIDSMLSPIYGQRCQEIYHAKYNYVVSKDNTTHTIIEIDLLLSKCKNIMRQDLINKKIMDMW